MSTLSSFEAENELRHFLKLARPSWSRPRRRGQKDITLVLRKLRAIGVWTTEQLVRRIQENTINDDLVSAGYGPFSRDAIEGMRSLIPFTRVLESADVPGVRQVGAFAPEPQLLSRRRLVHSLGSGRATAQGGAGLAEGGAPSLGSGAVTPGSAPSTLFGAGLGHHFWSSDDDDLGAPVLLSLRGANEAKTLKKAQIRRRRQLRLPTSLDPDSYRPCTTASVFSSTSCGGGTPMSSDVDDSSFCFTDVPPTPSPTGISPPPATTPSLGGSSSSTADVVGVGSVTELAPSLPSPRGSVSFNSPGVSEPKSAPLASRDSAVPSTAPQLPRCESSPTGGRRRSSFINFGIAGLSGGASTAAFRPVSQGSDGCFSPSLPIIRRELERPVTVCEVERLFRAGSNMSQGVGRKARWANSRVKTVQQLGEEMLVEQQALDKGTVLRREVRGSKDKDRALRSHVAANIRSRLREERERNSVEAIDFNQRCMNIRKDLATMTSFRRDLSHMRLQYLSLNEEEAPECNNTVAEFVAVIRSSREGGLLPSRHDINLSS